MLFNIRDRSAKMAGNTRKLVRYGMMSALSVAALSLAGTVAQAGQATTTLQVNITVNDACAFGPAASDNINFPAVDNLLTSVFAQGNIYVNCTSGTVFQIEMDAGKWAVAGTAFDVSNRRMRKGVAGTDYVGYSVYKPLGPPYTCDYTVEWGNLGAARYSFTGTGVSTQIPVCGKTKIAAATPAQGGYNDVLNVTINY